ncbi:hypothetical protein [Niallia sp. Krafla_26]|uniref:hypothetical protein n=1 Tax=Niallia sp. Krafla_26 TaxID=3064703 RepID=UPI003D164617
MGNCNSGGNVDTCSCDTCRLARLERSVNQLERNVARLDRELRQVDRELRVLDRRVNRIERRLGIDSTSQPMDEA